MFFIILQVVFEGFFDHPTRGHIKIDNIHMSSNIQLEECTRKPNSVFVSTPLCSFQILPILLLCLFFLLLFFSICSSIQPQLSPNHRVAKNVLMMEQHGHPNQDRILHVLATQAACPARLALASIMNSVFNRSRNMRTLLQN